MFQHAADSAVLSRLTDTSKYGGTHKNRFDSDGKGRGKDGRVDQKSNDGYVKGFKRPEDEKKEKH